LMIDEVNRDHASINTMGSNGVTILHVACAFGLAELLEPLFWRGASFDIFNEAGVIPLEEAVHNGDLDTVLFALALGADPTLGYPFVIASAAERHDIMETLTNYGADVNEEDSNGHTALQRATNKQNWDELHFLLSLGASPSTYLFGVDGVMLDTISHCDYQDSDRCVHEQIALTLLDHGVYIGRTHNTGVMLRFALRKANLQLLCAMLKRFTFPDVLNAIPDDHGLSVLHYAAQASKKHLSHQGQVMVSMLLTAGAGVNSRSNDGYTALDMAVEYGNQALVTMLLDAGAHVNTATDCKHPALTLAARRGNEEVARLLIADSCRR
jgi:ankyrin repeat protein